MMADKQRFRSKRLTPKKDHWSRRLRQPKMRKRAWNFIDSQTTGQDVELGKSRTRGGEVVYAKPVKADTAKMRVTAWMDHADGSDLLHIRIGTDVLAIQAVFVSNYVPGVDNDPHIIAFWDFVSKRTAGRAENWGIFSCRSIAGTSSWSAHAWKKAIDLSGPRIIMALIARLAVRHHGTFKLVVVIYNRRIWTPGSGWRPYTGQCPHQRHVHVNVDYPSGRPPCAK